MTKSHQTAHSVPLSCFTPIRTATHLGKLVDEAMATTTTGEQPLPADWESVEDEMGRTYYWNVDTNEVSWTRPRLVKATKDIAASTRAEI